jgi:hypothetical protein
LVFPDTTNSPAPGLDNTSMAAKIAFYLVFLKRFMSFI